MTSSPEIETNAHSTAGQLLRQARLQAGVHLAVLSIHLKVPVRQLEALEADELDPDKGPVFYRGLASSMCRQLNADPAPILARLPRLSGQLSPIQPSKLASDALLPGSRRGSWSHRIFSAKVFWLGFLLFALTASFLWLPSPYQWDIWGKLNFSSMNNPAPVQVTQEVSLQPTLVPSSAINPADDNKNPSQGPTPSSASTSATASSSAPSALSADSLAKGSSAVLAGSPSSVTWVFTARGESSIELRNAQNAVIWSGVLKAGETIRIDSPLPVQVVVGRAQMVSATLRGQPFDLAPHTQLNVARFEVKD